MFVEAAALTPLGHYRQVVLRHVPHEEQDVHVPGFAGGGGTKGSALLQTGKYILPPSAAGVPTQPLLWASRAATRGPAWTAERAFPPSSTDPPSSPQGSQGLRICGAHPFSLVPSLNRDSIKIEKLMVLKSKLRPFGYKEFLEINMKIEPISLCVKPKPSNRI